MNILLSAYACRPNMGSEPAVGWSWVMELSKYHDLWVLTNYTNKKYIEEYKKNNPKKLSNVKFIYIEVDKRIAFWYKEWERMERVYYWLWQKKAVKVAKNLKNTTHFDYVQHITYVTGILPTYMYKLDLPFIYGPISGGEKIPEIINYPMSMKNKFIEFIRSATQLIPRLSINTRMNLKKSKLVVTVTEESKQMIPKKYRDKVVIVQAIGVNDDFFYPEPRFCKKSSCKILIAGRMLYWKGFEIGISAAVQALDSGCDFELTVLGDGSENHIKKQMNIAKKYLGDKIKFRRYVEYDNIKEFYDEFDILLNCSLRDSGCLVVMEAMSRGLPIICIDTGGPAINTTYENSIKISPSEFNNLKNDLSKAIVKLVNDPELRLKMGKSSYQHAKLMFKNDSKIKNFLQFYK